MDLLALLKDRVTPMLMTSETSDIDAKKYALEQFYPFLLTALKAKPEWIGIFQNNLNPRLSDIFSGHTELKDQFLAAISQTASPNDVELLLNRSIPPVLNTIEDEAGSRDPVVIQHYLSQKHEGDHPSLAPWAQAILGAIGLGGLATTAQATVASLGQPTLNIAKNVDEALVIPNESVVEPIVPVSPEPTVVYSTVEPTPATVQKKSNGGFWSALVALIILLCLAFWGLRSCKNNDVQTTPVQTNQSGAITAQNDSIFVLSTDDKGQLQSCQANIGDASFIASLQQQIKQLFSHPTGCVTGTEGFTSALVDQEAFAGVLNLIKGVPGVSLTWTGNTLSLKGTDAVILQKLATQIQPLLKTAHVQLDQPLDINTAVNSSIDQAQQAMTAINPAQAQPQDIVKALNLQIINFASGSNAIPEANKAVLNQAATLMKALPNAQLVINGYTDSVGNADSNKVLSQKRAQAVADYLVAQGVDGSKLTVQGFGQENPVADNTTKEGQFKNRRIAFDVMQ